jgi:ribosomal protein L12E/L44/L45/RPP1/RPP2
LVHNWQYKKLQSYVRYSQKAQGIDKDRAQAEVLFRVAQGFFQQKIDTYPKMTLTGYRESAPVYLNYDKKVIGPRVLKRKELEKLANSNKAQKRVDDFKLRDTLKKLRMPQREPQYDNSERELTKQEKGLTRKKKGGAVPSNKEMDYFNKLNKYERKRDSIQTLRGHCWFMSDNVLNSFSSRGETSYDKTMKVIEGIFEKFDITELITSHIKGKEGQTKKDTKKKRRRNDDEDDEEEDFEDDEEEEEEDDGGLPYGYRPKDVYEGVIQTLALALFLNIPSAAKKAEEFFEACKKLDAGSSQARKFKLLASSILQIE